MTARQIAAYRTTNEITKAQRDAADAKRETAEVRAQQEPRQLSPRKQEIPVDLLSQAKGAEFMVTGTVGSLESMQYAIQLATALRQAGWHVKSIGQWDVYFPGVAVLEKPESVNSAAAELLRQSLRVVGVDLHLKEHDENAVGALHSAVGAKP